MSGRGRGNERDPWEDLFEGRQGDPYDDLGGNVRRLEPKRNERDRRQASEAAADLTEHPPGQISEAAQAAAVAGIEKARAQLRLRGRRR